VPKHVVFFQLQLLNTFIDAVVFHYIFLLYLVRKDMLGGGHVANMGKKRNASRAFWWGNSNERDHFRDVCVDGRIIVKWILNK
jgi:hypothetical protein